MVNERECELYSPEWGALSMDERIERWLVLNNGFIEGGRVDVFRRFLSEFASNYRAFDRNTIENLLFELRERAPDEPEFWTEREKAKVFEGVLAVYNMPPEHLEFGGFIAQRKSYLNN
ncbi:MAG: hypothetical protein MUF61_00740 [archaeon]|jgi:hypothetical protein|nr:hypothetical protein [archaeon]